VYRKFGIPVTLSTDDEGVGRTHLTEEFQRAVLTYGLSYADVKQLVRNSLQYSFVSGEGYWTDSSYRHPVKACASGMAGETCQSFLAANQKARLQADLEKRFQVFEAAQWN
jgi:adenosine deaminase